MKKEQEIKSLIKECVAWLKNNSYSERRIADYQSLWSNGIIQYMNLNLILDYNADIGEKFINTSLPDVCASQKRAYRRSVNVLTDYLTFGNIRFRIVPYSHYELPGAIGEIANEHIASLAAKRRSVTTLNEHRRILSFFIKHLSLKFIFHISEVKEEDVLSFLASAQNSKPNYLNTMRLFCRYLYEQKHLPRNIEYVLGKNCFPIREKLPSIYSVEEILQIEKSADQASPVGKRDYAMLLLATRLGLRASDIVGLQFSNLDWDKNIICLTQYKTRQEMDLPLLTEVGEAIINYLKYGRPVSESKQIFLSASAPYRPINRMIINGAISRIMKSSGINIRNRKTGPHSMRHSLASRLLSNGVGLPIISESLGHADSKTTMNYLRIDINNLMRCALDVPIVSKEFYQQKGGVFYE
jgi:site-specific recombinase XerD